MPEDRLQELNRAQLAQLCREYMLAAQFNSRTGYAALSINHGQEAYLKIAIENWMAASPNGCDGCSSEPKFRGFLL